MKGESLHVLEHFRMGPDAWLLRLSRPSWSWKAGQLISLGGENPMDQRDYSIASGEQDKSLDVLYRRIPHGTVTSHLVNYQPGDSVPVQGPYGRFTLKDPSSPLVFCATGTGIAPCRGFLRSYAELDLRILHGVRYPEDLYFREEFSEVRYHPFCSRSPLNGRQQHLTDFLKTMDLPAGASYYLCGANEMIYEAESILTGRGVDSADLFHEPYYYREYDG